MKRIAELVDKIDEELMGAKEYAEEYLMCKANDNLWASKFKEMAEDELKHATYIHEYAIAEINKLKEVYTAPVEMQEIWDKSHKEYIEKASWIKNMMTM